MTMRLMKILAKDIVNGWVAKNKSYLWSISPTEICMLIDGNGPHQTITYDGFSSILRRAETTKMRGDANAGFAWMREQFKKQANDLTQFQSTQPKRR